MFIFFFSLKIGLLARVYFIPVFGGVVGDVMVLFELVVFVVAVV